MPLIGVLAIQGAYMAHAHRLNDLGADTRLVRHPVDFEDLDGLVLPGGESTTMLRFLYPDESRDVGGQPLWHALREFVSCKPTLGTCAGLILLAKHVVPAQPSLGLLDVCVQRNAYGRQRDSRVITVQSELKGGPLEMLFIRAPRIESIGRGVEVLAERENSPVLVRENHLIGCAFHPELGSDPRVHQLLLDMC